MSAIEHELKTYLLTKAAITAIVGTRIYDTRAAQTATQNKLQDHIVLRALPGAVRHYHAGGVSTLVEASIDIKCVASSTVDTNTLYQKIRNEIDAYKGTWGSTTIKFSFLSPPYNASGNPSQGDDVGFPATGAVVEVMYTESAPVPT